MWPISNLLGDIFYVEWLIFSATFGEAEKSKVFESAVNQGRSPIKTKNNGGSFPYLNHFDFIYINACTSFIAYISSPLCKGYNVFFIKTESVF